LQSLIRKIEFICERFIYHIGDQNNDITIIDDYLYQLYRMIMEPVLIGTDAKRIIIIPHQHYSQIPFTALRMAEGVYLKDNLEICLLPNPGDILNLNNRKEGADWKRNAVFTVNSSGLPLLPVEGRRLRRIYKDARAYSGSAATIENLVKELSVADGFVHIAAHASRSSENPLFSRILMDNGPFFPFDLFKTGVKARLVTLSGCQTAAPGLYFGNSFSLARSFYQAGADHVVASLWPALDEISVEFMAQFYRHLKHTKSVNLAFNRALNALQEKAPHPALWGNFILLGV